MLNSFGDPAPQLSLKWNEGVNNFMVYSRGGIPVGDYNADRIVNLGDGHASWDNGILGYTYFNATTGFEFSAVSGLTYNFTNPHTDYQNGIDWHVDLEASRFLTKQFYFGAVGYTSRRANRSIHPEPRARLCGSWRSRNRRSAGTARVRPHFVFEVSCLSAGQPLCSRQCSYLFTQIEAVKLAFSVVQRRLHPASEKPCSINVRQMPLNQRVQGSSPCAPTKHFKGLADRKAIRKNPCVRTMSESTRQVDDIGRLVDRVRAAVGPKGKVGHGTLPHCMIVELIDDCAGRPLW